MITKITPYFLSFTLTLLSLFLHLFSCDSTMINGGTFGISNETITSIVDLHKTHPVFIRRQLTTIIVENVSKWFFLTLGESFVLVNFSLLFICGVLLFYFSQLFFKNTKLGLVNIVAFFLCFSNLFAFFSPVYTYDEPLQFLFILISLIAFFKEKHIEFIVAFSLSLITRESGVILLPGLFLFFVYNNKNSLIKNLLDAKVLKKVVVFIVPILIYAIYLYITMSNIKDIESSKAYFLQRFSYLKWNFQNFRFAFESIMGIFLIFLVPFYFLYVKYKEKKVLNPVQKKLVGAFWTTFIINTLIVLLNTKAREVRLFVIPMFFLWPVFGWLFFEEIKKIFDIKLYGQVFLSIQRIVFFVFLNVLNFYLSFMFYRTTIGPEISVFNIWLFLSVLVVIIHFVLTYKCSVNLSVTKKQKKLS